MELMETPGEILKAALEAAGLSQSELARRLKRSPGYLSEVISGKRRITTVLALDLDAVSELDMTAEGWLELQHDYDLEQARQRRAREGQQ